MYSDVKITTGIIKCALCAKTVILVSMSACVMLRCCKSSQELPEDGVDKRRNAAELKRDQLIKWLINCW